MFGLGRYLYTLPSVWADYDKERRTFTAQGLAKLQGMVATHYRQAMGEPSQTEAPNGAVSTASADDAGAALRAEFDELGGRLYGSQWGQVRAHNIERISAGQTTDPAQLSNEQVSRLIDGLKSLQRSRAKQAA
jgi:hypothetical protein